MKNVSLTIIFSYSSPCFSTSFHRWKKICKIWQLFSLFYRIYRNCSRVFHSAQFQKHSVLHQQFLCSNILLLHMMKAEEERLCLVLLQHWISISGKLNEIGCQGSFNVAENNFTMDHFSHGSVSKNKNSNVWKSSRFHVSKWKSPREVWEI